ncbi:MAG: DNA repair protein RadC [Bacillota bacterium]|nr:DNA repair protein RadC [Bacillota bacterium]MDW7677362.1 DNA repair protein RadC [Bacillota bacterium]
MTASGYQATIKEMPESERPRERMQQEGPHVLSNAELIGIILSSGTQNISAIELGRMVLCHQPEGLAFLRNCTVEELCVIKGVGPAKACQILAAVELGKRITLTERNQRYKIKCPADISRLLMEDLRFLKKEKFCVLLLNTKHEVMTIEEISVGSLNASIVHPREVFLPAIKKSSSAVILVHNHPSGDPTPSKEDIQITKRLIESGALIGISVLDHVIIGDNIFTSLREIEACTF